MLEFVTEVKCLGCVKVSLIFVNILILCAISIFMIYSWCCIPVGKCEISGFSFPVPLTDISPISFPSSWRYTEFFIILEIAACFYFRVILLFS